jgi:hypothetical protein
LRISAHSTLPFTNFLGYSPKAFRYILESG